MDFTANSPSIRLISYSYLLLKDWSYAVPLRGHWRMWWAESEGSGIELQDQFYPIGSNFIQVVPPNTAINHVLNKPVKSLSFHFSLGQPYDAFKGKILQYLLTADSKKRIMNIINTLNKDAGNTSLKYSFELYSLIMQIISTINDNEWPEESQNQYIQQALLLMEKFLGEPLENNSIAKELGISENAFIKLFKKVMNISPQKYLQYRRLEAASIELAHNNDSIKTIASRFAFCDRYYFSRQFKKRYKISPAAYRKEFFNNMKLGCG